MSWMVQRRRDALLCASAVGVVVATLYLVRRRRSCSEALTPQSSSNMTGEDEVPSDGHEGNVRQETNDCAVAVPILGLVFEDKGFAGWTLSRHGVWYEYLAEDATEVTPSGIVEFVLEGDAGQPLISIVAEDLMMMSSTAAEYVERSRQGLPTEAWELENIDFLDKSESSAAAPNSATLQRDDDVETVDGLQVREDKVNSWEDCVDTCCCAFTELAEWRRGEHVERRVINMVAIRLGIAVVLQLSCRDSDEDRGKHMAMFRRICSSTIRQLRSPTCDIARRSREHFVQFGLPSSRNDRPGVLMTLPVGCLQMLDLATHPVAQILQKVVGSNITSGVVGFGTPALTSPHVQRPSMIACVEKRSRGFEETVETYLVQLTRRSAYQRVVQEVASVDVGRRSAVCQRDDLLCVVIAVAGTQGAADERARAVCEALKPFNQHNCCVNYLHMPSGIFYNLPKAAMTPKPTFLTQFFGPFSFQAFPRGASSQQASMRVSIRDIHDGETLASLQREATKDYDERWINRRPSVEGWVRLDVSLEAPDGSRTMEYVTMLEHRGRFVHVVWNCPQGVTGMADDVLRCLHLV